MLAKKSDLQYILADEGEMDGNPNIESDDEPEPAVVQPTKGKRANKIIPEYSSCVVCFIEHLIQLIAS